MIAVAVAVGVASLVVGLAASVLVRHLPTLRLQLAGMVLVSAVLPLLAVSLSGMVMFHMGADIELLGVSAAAALAGVGGALLVARRIVRGLGKVGDAATGLASGELSVRAPEAGPRELAELARSFNAMAGSLERLFEARREVVAWASHDLRTPVAALRAMVEAISDGVVPAERYLPAMLERVQILGALLDELFALARIDAGELVTELQDVPVSALVERCLRGWEAQAQRQGVRLIDRATGSGETARCAPEAVERVLGNLVTNALRHTPDGGTVTLEVSRADHEITVVVEDSGTGIPAAALERVAEPFFRVDVSRPADDDGQAHAGLGLAIARGLVEAQGGRLTIGNRPEGGARVSFTLPVVGTTSGDPEARSALSDK